MCDTPTTTRRVRRTWQQSSAASPFSAERLSIILASRQCSSESDTTSPTLVSPTSCKSPSVVAATQATSNHSKLVPSEPMTAGGTLPRAARTRRVLPTPKIPDSTPTVVEAPLSDNGEALMEVKTGRQRWDVYLPENTSTRQVRNIIHSWREREKGHKGILKNGGGLQGSQRLSQSIDQLADICALEDNREDQRQPWGTQGYIRSCVTPTPCTRFSRKIVTFTDRPGVNDAGDEADNASQLLLPSHMMDRPAHKRTPHSVKTASLTVLDISKKEKSDDESAETDSGYNETRPFTEVLQHWQAVHTTRQSEHGEGEEQFSPRSRLFIPSPGPHSPREVIVKAPKDGEGKRHPSHFTLPSTDKLSQGYDQRGPNSSTSGSVSGMKPPNREDVIRSRSGTIEDVNDAVPSQHLSHMLRVRERIGLFESPTRVLTPVAVAVAKFEADSSTARQSFSSHFRAKSPSVVKLRSSSPAPTAKTLKTSVSKTPVPRYRAAQDGRNSSAPATTRSSQNMTQISPATTSKSQNTARITPTSTSKSQNTTPTSLATISKSLNTTHILPATTSKSQKSTVVFNPAHNTVTTESTCVRPSVRLTGVSRLLAKKTQPLRLRSHSAGSILDVEINNNDEFEPVFEKKNPLCDPDDKKPGIFLNNPGMMKSLWSTQSSDNEIGKFAGEQSPQDEQRDVTQRESTGIVHRSAVEHESVADAAEGVTEIRGNEVELSLTQVHTGHDVDIGHTGEHTHADEIKTDYVQKDDNDDKVDQCSESCEYSTDAVDAPASSPAKDISPCVVSTTHYVSLESSPDYFFSSSVVSSATLPRTKSKRALPSLPARSITTVLKSPPPRESHVRSDFTAYDGVKSKLTLGGSVNVSAKSRETYTESDNFQSNFSDKTAPSSVKVVPVQPVGKVVQAVRVVQSFGEVLQTDGTAVHPVGKGLKSVDNDYTQAYTPQFSTTQPTQQSIPSTQSPLTSFTSAIPSRPSLNHLPNTQTIKYITPSPSPSPARMLSPTDSILSDYSTDSRPSFRSLSRSQSPFSIPLSRWGSRGTLSRPKQSLHSISQLLQRALTPSRELLNQCGKEDDQLPESVTPRLRKGLSEPDLVLACRPAEKSHGKTAAKSPRVDGTAVSSRFLKLASSTDLSTMGLSSSKSMVNLEPNDESSVKVPRSPSVRDEVHLYRKKRNLFRNKASDYKAATTVKPYLNYVFSV